MHNGSLTMVADDASPAVLTVTAIFPLVALASVQTVVTCQAAVVTKSVIQTHWKKTSKETVASQLPR